MKLFSRCYDRSDLVYSCSVDSAYVQCNMQYGLYLSKAILKKIDACPDFHAERCAE